MSASVLFGRPGADRRAKITIRRRLNDLHAVLSRMVARASSSGPIPLRIAPATPSEWVTALRGNAAEDFDFTAAESRGSDAAPATLQIIDESLLSSDALAVAIIDAYRDLAPGDYLVLIAGSTDRSADPKRPVAQDRSWRDRRSGALFHAGFVETRIRGGVAVARRGAELPPTERDGRLSVILPVYNEATTFLHVIEPLLDKKIDGMTIEVIIVESNSTDGTRTEVLGFADHPRVRVVLEDAPLGKGHAVRTGLAAARGDYLLIQDADLEYRLDDYESLLEPLRDDRASFVLGARERSHGARWGLRHFERELIISRAMNLGHIGFLRLFNLVYRSDLEDPFTMYKVLRRDCLNGVILECDRFDFDWELVGKLIRLGYRPLEIPVSYHSRPFSEGKKISILRDPLTWVIACFKYRFARLER